jgi:FKBP-type peptidyl-prolyl cis-trans isomerase
LAVAGALATAPASAATPATPPSFASEDQELLYFWGTSFGQQLQAAGVTDATSLEWIQRGMRDAAAAQSPTFGEEYPSLLNNYLVLRRKAAAEAEAAAGTVALQELARERGAVRKPSGLVFIGLERGRGARPGKDAEITVHYTGRLRDGTIFDSSTERGSPLETRLGTVIACWQEALPLMRVGGKARVGCPAELAYGQTGNARVPGGAMLTFEIELLAVEE